MNLKYQNPYKRIKFFFFFFQRGFILLILMRLKILILMRNRLLMLTIFATVIKETVFFCDKKPKTRRKFQEFRDFFCEDKTN